MLTILIPTDFSDAAEKAAEFAIHLADQNRINLVFFHEYHSKRPPATGQSEQQQLLKEVKEEHTERLVNHVKALFIRLNKEYRSDRVDFYLSEGFNLPENIVEAAQHYSVDLIMTGTTGANSLGKKLFGSNTSNLMTISRFPVLSIPPSFTVKSLDRLALATTLTHINSELIRIMDIVKILNVGLDVFFVYPNFPEHVNLDDYTPRDLEVTWRQKFGHEDVRFYFVHTSDTNDTRAGIEEFIHLYKPCVLAMFMRERSLFDKVLNASLTANVVNYLKLPVLSIKD